MTNKPTYDELRQRVNVLESEIAEYRNHDDALNELASIYLSVFESVPASIVVVDKKGQIIDVNPYHIVNIGKGKTTKEDYLHHQICDHPSVVAAGLKDSYGRVLKGESIEERGVLFPLTSGGTEGFFNIRGVPLLKGDEVIGAVMIHEDITDLKKAERDFQKARDDLEKRVEERTAELVETNKQLRGEVEDRKVAKEEGRVSSEKYQKIFQAVPNLMAVSRMEDGTYLEVNDDFVEATGLTKEEIIGKTSFEMGIVAETEYRERMKRDLEKNGRFRGVEIAIQLKDGIIHDGLLSGELFEINGEKHLITVWTDITERKLAEAKLRAVSELNENIVNSSPIGISIYNSVGDCIAANEAVARVVGATKDEVLQQNYHQIESWKKSGLYAAALSSMQDHEAKHYEMEVKTTFGKEGLFDCHLRPIGIEGESHLLLMIFDITDRKRAEKDRARLKEQLRQAQKMESIGTLAGGIAHDFNNILGIIVGNTELAMNDIPEWNQARHNLEEVIKASLRARDMVKQILAFSRQTEKETRPMRLSPIVKESLKLLRSSIPSTIEIRMDLATHADTILADPTQMNQILMNLCSNAAHAMRERGGILGVGLKNIDLDEQDAARYYGLTPGGYLSLAVSDTGQGMDSEVIDRIFEPYFTTKDVGEGTGMGLSVVHGIVKTHNGAIRVHSEPGKGTSFNVMLPLSESEIEVPSTVAGALPTGTERVLFVDDEKSLADLGERMLCHFGYEVTVRTSSIEALEIFRAQPDRFDLVVTDMTMPNMTGMDLSQELLRLRPDIPIVLCTGFSEMVTEAKARELGIKALVMKPLVLREIAQILRRVLDQEE